MAVTHGGSFVLMNKKFAKYCALYIKSQRNGYEWLKDSEKYVIMNASIHYNLSECPCRYADHRSAPCISGDYNITLRFYVIMNANVSESHLGYTYRVIAA